MKGSIWRLVVSIGMAGLGIGLVACAFRSEFVSSGYYTYTPPNDFYNGYGGEVVLDSSGYSFSDWNGTIRLMEVSDSVLAVIMADTSISGGPSGRGYLHDMYILPDSLSEEFIENDIRVRFSAHPRYSMDHDSYFIRLVDEDTNKEIFIFRYRMTYIEKAD